MSADEALARYEAARHRLPPVPEAGAPRKIADLSEIADDYDVFLLDAFGVLNIGEEAIPGTPERIDALREAGKRVMVLTNAASVPQAALVGKYRRLGYEFRPDDLISSRAVLLKAVRAAPERRWGVMTVEETPGADLDGLRLAMLEDDPAVYASVDGFLLLGSGKWTETRHGLLEAALTERPRPVWVGNPDLVAPRQSGFSIEPGYYAHRLADIPSVTLRFFGKPFPEIYEEAFDRIGPDVDRARILMVGDSLHTDILGARNAGIASALMTRFGFFAGQSAPDALATTGISPDYLTEAL